MQGVREAKLSAALIQEPVETIATEVQATAEAGEEGLVLLIRIQAEPDRRLAEQEEEVDTMVIATAEAEAGEEGAMVLSDISGAEGAEGQTVAQVFQEGDPIPLAVRGTPPEEAEEEHTEALPLRLLNSVPEEGLED